MYCNLSEEKFDDFLASEENLIQSLEHIMKNISYKMIEFYNNDDNNDNNGFINIDSNSTTEVI